VCDEGCVLPSYARVNPQEALFSGALLGVTGK